MKLMTTGPKIRCDIKNAVILSEGEPTGFRFSQDLPEPQSKDLYRLEENFASATLKGLSSYSPGLAQQRLPWVSLVRSNPVRVESITGLVVGLLFFAFFGITSAQTNAPVTPTPATNSAQQPVTPAQTDPFSDPLIKQVQARHEKAVGGDTAETKSLTSDLEKWTKEQPNNHLLQAYLGSVYTLDSRDAWPGPGKLTYLRNGGKELDAAVGAEPDNPAVRFVRAIDYYSLPTFFGKRPTARDDFVILVKQVEGVIQTPFTLNVETQQAIYYYAGLCYEQLSQRADAKDAWQRGFKLNPTSPLGVKIEAELAKIK